MKGGAYTKYLYSKCNIYPYIALKYIPLQVTVHFSSLKSEPLDKLYLWVLFHEKDAMEGTMGMDALSFRSGFTTGFRSLPVCLLAYVFINTSQRTRIKQSTLDCFVHAYMSLWGI